MSEMQLQDLADLLRYLCLSAQGLLPQRPRLALLVYRTSARIQSFRRSWFGANRPRQPL